MTFIAAGVTAGTAAAVAAGATAGGLAAAAGGALGGALAGAALGAGISAVSGGDVGKGALYGGIGGAVSGVAGPALAAAGDAGAAGGAGGAAGGAGGTAGASIGAASGNAISSGIASAAPETISASDAAVQAAITPTFSSVGQGAIAAGQNVAPTALQTAASQAIPSTVAEAAPSLFQQGVTGLGNYIKDNPIKAIQGAVTVGQGINALTQTYPDVAPKQGMKPRNTHLAPNYQRSAPISYKPLASYAEGGIAQSGMFPQSMQDTNQYATPSQMPQQAQMLAGQAVNADYGQKTGVYTGEPISFAEGGAAPPMNKYYAAGLAQAHAEQQARQQMQQPLQTVAPAPGPMPAAIPQAPLQPAPTAPGGQSGIASLQGYARGRLISGPGDGVSDDIKASIDGKQPARLASNEYVLPARFVSEIGNGSSEAGAKRLDKMVADVQRKRSKTVGKGKIAVNSRAFKSLPV